MASVFIAALFALTPIAATSVSASGPADLDRRCFRLMAELSENDDPRIRSAGLVGAQYFLGRIDAESANFDPAADATALPQGAEERDALIRQCGSTMGAGGRDFRAIGNSLAQRRPQI